MPTGSMELSSVESQLQAKGSVALLDLGLGLPPGARALLETRMRQFSGSDGAKAWVIAIPRNRNVEDLKAVFADLGMHGRDSLIVFNGDKRHVHVGLLGKADAEGVLAASRDRYRKDPVDGVIAMIDDIDRRLAAQAQGGATTSTVKQGAGGPPHAEPRKGGSAVLIVVALVLAAAVAFVAFRRRKVDSSVATEHAEAKKAAEAAVSELLLALSGMPTDEAVSRALDRANALQTQLLSVGKQGISRPSLERLRSLGREASRMRGQLKELPAAPPAS